MYALIGAIVAAVVVGITIVMVTRGERTPTATPSTAAAATSPSSVAVISGVVDYRSSTPAALTRNHRQGPLTYAQSPPVGGDHNPVWQRCTGGVYNAPIANEHAVHSLEHGAVWVTFRPDLAADQVAALAAKVRNVDYMLMSPYPGLDRPVSLQAWGYQLKLDSATDARIDQFIVAARIRLAPEPGATCGGGVAATGTTPQNATGGM